MIRAVELENRQQLGASASAPLAVPESAIAYRREELTERQAEVLRIVVSYYRVTGEPCPSVIVAKRLRLHHETIRGHFGALYRKGFLVGDASPATPRRPFLSRR